MSFTGITLSIGLVTLISVSSVSADNWFGKKIFGSGIKGSGDIVTQERQIDDFDRIDLSGSMDLEVKVGPSASLTISFDDNLIDLIVTEVDGGTLEIYSEESFRSRKSCKIVITVPSLVEVISSGSGDVSVDRLSGKSFEYTNSGSGDFQANGKVDELEVSLKGSGDVTLSDIETKFFEFRVNGSGNLQVQGRTDVFEVRISGSGDVNAQDFKSREANVVIRGSGDAQVYASESFDGAVYGSGDITYLGNPKNRSKHIAGSGSIKRR